MNLKFELLLLIFGGLLRIIGTGASLWYFLTQKFSSELLYYLCGVFILAPSLVFFLITTFVISIEMCRCKCSEIFFKLGFGLLITFGGPLGIPLFVYAAILACNTSHTGDFFIIEGLSRSTTLIEALFESLPQIAIQVFNNQLLGEWGTLKYCSISVSTLGIIYSLYKLCYAIDKIKQYEYATAETKNAPVKINQVSDNRFTNEGEVEVYDISDN